jgi:lipopolysaccharide/colanic/teichoic acid biosynthesis glycosyltransferase
MSTIPAPVTEACPPARHGVDEAPPDDDALDALQRAYASSACKRVLDVLIAGSGLVLLTPLLVVIALVVRRDSPGPILYRQVRVGRNRRRHIRRAQRAEATCSGQERRRCPGEGRPFEILKFRTMMVNAEPDGPQLEEENDRRVTRAGRWLRRTHLDELPQLWNVLRGDMSLVGPRPERPFFVDQFVVEMHGFRRRLAVRPGLTGLAQLENGYDRSPADVVRKLHLDLQYLRSASLFTDLRLLGRTVPHLLPRRR